MKNLNIISLITVLSYMLFACTSDTSSSVIAQTKNKNMSTPIGKPSSAPITMDYKILNPLAKAGEEIHVEVKFNSREKAPVNSKITSANSKITSAKKLTWISSDTSWQSEMTKSGNRESLPIMKVVAPTDGIYYIRMMATIELDGKSLSKPFIIPVRVGDSTFELEPVGEVVTDEKGQT
ncbi:MAG: hypothetical protein GY829_07265, partial [Gammaproteobacteria bacterium]|nr:hypothetical protein [Gammaproteobacteria bacterium]